MKKIGQILHKEESIKEGKILRNFIRTRVLLDDTKPLPAGCWIPRSGLPRLWVSYKYERLQDLCFNCFVIGHDQKGCKKEKAMAT